MFSVKHSLLTSLCGKLVLIVLVSVMSSQHDVHMIFLALVLSFLYRLFFQMTNISSVNAHSNTLFLPAFLFLLSFRSCSISAIVRLCFQQISAILVTYSSFLIVINLFLFSVKYSLLTSLRWKLVLMG